MKEALQSLTHLHEAISCQQDVTLLTKLFSLCIIIKQSKVFKSTLLKLDVAVDRVNWETEEYLIGICKPLPSSGSTKIFKILFHHPVMSKNYVVADEQLVSSRKGMKIRGRCQKVENFTVD